MSCGVTTVAALHDIWKARLRRMEPGQVSETTHGIFAHVALHGTLTRRAASWQQSSAAPCHSVVRALCQVLLDAESLPPMRIDPVAAANDTRFLLFFDRGSRGNPGPGGAGLVIVRVAIASYSATVLWVASMAYGNRGTTDNVAEYQSTSSAIARWSSAKCGSTGRLRILSLRLSTGKRCPRGPARRAELSAPL